jgi:hypothetical protein
MPTGAVITADIVNSTLLTREQEKKLLSQLTVVLQEYKYEFYRGDSFQVYLKNYQLALLVVLLSRATARAFSYSFDVRASIGIAQVEAPVRSLKTATGEAFILSGRAFDEMDMDERLKIQSADEQANIALRLIASYCDHLFRHMTPKQAAVLNELLKGRTQMEAAKKLHITQATLNQHAQAAGWNEIEKLLKEYQQTILKFNIA